MQHCILRDSQLRIWVGPRKCSHCTSFSFLEVFRNSTFSVNTILFTQFSIPGLPFEGITVADLGGTPQIPPLVLDDPSVRWSLIHISNAPHSLDCWTMWVQANTHVRLITGKYVEFHVKFCLLVKACNVAFDWTTKCSLKKVPITSTKSVPHSTKLLMVYTFKHLLGFVATPSVVSRTICRYQA